MRRSLPLLLLLPLAGAAADLPKVPDAPSPPRPELAAFAGLAGCWRLEHGQQTVEEWWMGPAGDSLQGMARSVQEGRTLEYELTRIVKAADGTVGFEAHPSGQPAAFFPLLSWDGTRAVFQDLGHDFPQRIIYTLTSADRLDARVEGTADGKMLGFDYPYRGVPCVLDNGKLSPPPAP